MIINLCLQVSILYFLIETALASLGNQNKYFENCQSVCVAEICNTKTGYRDFVEKQPMYMRTLLWDCPSECQYDCMWNTSDYLTSKGYGIQKYFGKWPFVRFLGMQEPASTISSFLNGMAHAIGICKFRRSVPKTAPTYWVCHAFAIISMNAWLWSTVFHTRDFPFTEKMDYFCALSGVAFSLYMCILRVLNNYKLWTALAVAAPFLAFYVYHIHYLAFVRFDYGYNMKVNITIACVTFVSWTTWSLVNLRRKKFMWRMLVVNVCTAIFLSFEVFDFAPVFWVFDAHSLWHISTIPLPLLLYSFCTLDALDLLMEREAKKKKVP